MNIMTCIPGKIESYDGRVATIRPAIAMLLANGEELPAPPIQNVPPMWATGSRGAFITIPLAAGDDVLIFFSQRSIDEWKQGFDSAPSDPRQYDLNDAFFTPVLRPTKQKADTQNLSLEYGGGSIKITPQGKILIDGDVEVKGTLHASTDVTAGQSPADTISLTSHVHLAGTPNTGPPTNPPTP